MNNTQNEINRTRTFIVFFITLFLGYAVFIIPDVFFGVTKINGGKVGINLFYIAVFQLIGILLLLGLSLRLLNKKFKDIGLVFSNFKKDILWGLLVAIFWTSLQFLLIIPNTGGENRADIQQMLSMFDGTSLGSISYISLGVIGGGITEEIFNRGYFISVLKDVFKNPKFGLWISAIISIIIFSLGHMPSGPLEWFDILIPTIMYTMLFLYTKRLTAPIIAHGIYNASAIILTYYIYFLK